MVKEKKTPKPVVTTPRIKRVLSKKIVIVAVSIFGVVLLAAAVVGALVWLKGLPDNGEPEAEWKPNAATQLRQKFDESVKQDPETAATLYDTAIKETDNAKEQTSLRIARTTALSENGKYDEAIKSALESIEIERNHETLIAASWAYNIKNDKAKALEYAKLAREALEADQTVEEFDKEYALRGYADMISELSS